MLHYISSNINEVITAVLNPLLFFYEDILHAPKAPKAQETQKAQKRNQAKVQNATSEQKSAQKTLSGKE